MNTLVLFNNQTSWFHPFSEVSILEPFVFPERYSIDESFTNDTKSYTLEYRIPGFKKKNLSLSIKDDVLIIEGKQKDHTGFYFNKNSKHCEKSFVRKTKLRNDMNTDEMKARFKNGILKIEIPKKQEFISYREITVQGEQKTDTIQETSKTSTFNKIKERIKSLF